MFAPGWHLFSPFSAESLLPSRTDPRAIIVWTDAPNMEWLPDPFNVVSGNDAPTPLITVKAQADSPVEYWCEICLPGTRFDDADGSYDTFDTVAAAIAPALVAWAGEFELTLPVPEVPT